MRLTFEKYCCYCGKLLNQKDLDYTKEHLVPKSRGGNNSEINKKPCCKKCNNWRGNQTFEQFKTNVQRHLHNKILDRGYTLYDYQIMIENIQYWNDFVASNKKNFIK